MGRRSKIVFAVLAGAIFLVTSGKLEPSHSETLDSVTPSGVAPLPVFIETVATGATRERPPVAFDHDRHVKSLKQTKMEDCGVCHRLKTQDGRLSDPNVTVFRFPKSTFDETDKAATMTAYHEACVSCHQKRASEGMPTGPAIGLCGKCHVKRPEVRKVKWAWQPIFNYARHADHLKALDQVKDAGQLGVAGNVQVMGEIPANSRCQLCHHSYDAVAKKLIYKKDTENSCGACHKSRDEKNARAMRKVAHAACIGCHMKMAESAKTQQMTKNEQGTGGKSAQRFGPTQCVGCHAKHEELKPDLIAGIPRLVRGQKDVMEVFLKDPETARMKMVPYNHKAHEPRAQFCNSCHHHSLEKCSSCHTTSGSPKGGGVTFERAFHKASSKQACVGCHNVAKQDRKCAGCHQNDDEKLPQASCPVCHRGPSDGKPIDAPPASIVFDKEKVPEKIQIKSLEKEFKPADLPHQKIVAKLTALSNQNSLARVFHSARGDAILCSGCHHKSDPAAAQTKKVPVCRSCHGKPFEPGALGKPGILAAYHRQCMGCHEAMHQKPAPLECVKCHPAKAPVKANEAVRERLGTLEREGGPKVGPVSLDAGSLPESSMR